MAESRKEEINLDRDADGLVRDATQSHIKVKTVYKPEDIAEDQYEQDLDLCFKVLPLRCAMPYSVTT